MDKFKSNKSNLKILANNDLRDKIDHYKSGTVKAKGLWNQKNKLPVGLWVFNNIFGRPSETGHFDNNGLRVGEWKRYDWDMGHIFTRKYKNGKPIGSERYIGTIKKEFPEIFEEALKNFDRICSVLFEKRSTFLNNPYMPRF